MKKVAILQSNYIPWKGYFDIIAAVDEFILYDEVQYTRRDWRNRNLMKTPNGTRWLTVPVMVKGCFHQRIVETKVDTTAWPTTHWKAFEQNYSRARYFDDIADWLAPLYRESRHVYLSEWNAMFIRNICNYLGIRTRISNSADYHVQGGATERLVGICIASGATEYVSGPAGKNYIDESRFAGVGVKLSWFDYDGYPEHPQLWGEFVHQVTILDLLFNCGRDAPNYMKYVRP